MVREGQTYRFIFDDIGSVRAVINAATGVAAQTIDYDARGRVVSNSNPGFQPFGFAGCLYDAVTGLCHFGAREYDASIGRWLSRDPSLLDGGDENAFVYAKSDPVNRADRDGLVDLTIISTEKAEDIQAVLVTLYVAKQTGLLAKAMAEIIVAGSKVTHDFAALYAAAEASYPGKVGKRQLHHLFSIYLGGDRNGLLANIPAAYHQQITNFIRNEWAYGQGRPTVERAIDIVLKAMQQFPIDPNDLVFR
jgi:RHS repeat-associated protein